MADPFEVRMRFTSQLRQLNASVTSAQKAAQYALKYRDLAEDLHSCILEQLERNNMNTRANIMFFIEHFLDMAHKDGHLDYVRMMQRDIIRVVDAVAPDDGSGAANVKVVRKVLRALHDKSFLESQAVTQIEEVLTERETAAQDIAMSSPPSNADGGSDPMAADNLGDMPPSQTLPAPYKKATISAAAGLDRKQIEQRIEEDRERHKRQRENIWAVPETDEAELDKLWDETSSLGSDDHRMGEEEYQEWKAQVSNTCPHHKDEKANGEGHS